jgi:CS domain
LYASFYLKKIDASKSTIKFASSDTVELDLHTSDSKQYTTTIQLYGHIVPEKSAFKCMGTKLELTLAKADGAGWPVLRATDPTGGQIIQSGRAGRV